MQKSPSTCNQNCSSIQIICRHTILTVKEADVHIKADKVVHMLQLTIRSQNPSTSSHAKGGLACTRLWMWIWGCLDEVVGASTYVVNFVVIATHQWANTASGEMMMMMWVVGSLDR